MDKHTDIINVDFFDEAEKKIEEMIIKVNGNELLKRYLEAVKEFTEANRAFVQVAHSFIDRMKE